MTSACLNCRRTIFDAGGVEHCRDGVVVGYTCGKAMRATCEQLMRERKQRPFAFRAIKRIARKAIADAVVEKPEQGAAP